MFLCILLLSDALRLAYGNVGKPPFWVLCAYVTIMSFNQMLSASIAQALSSSNKSTVMVDPKYWPVNQCHEGFLRDIETFIGMREKFLHLYRHHNLSPQTEIGLLQQWSNRTGIGDPALHGHLVQYCTMRISLYITHATMTEVIVAEIPLHGNNCRVDSAVTARELA